MDVEASETPADAPPTKKKVVLVVDVPPSIPDGDDAVAKEFVTEKQANPAVLKNSKSFVAPRLYRDEDVHEAGRRGWISGPCDCIVSIGATLGDAIEGGADQIVGLALLMISGAIAFVASGGFASLWTKWFDGDAVEGSNQGASAAPPPPSVLHHAVHSSSVYAQAHPSAFVALLLGGLVTIGLLVIFEEDLHRSLNALRLRWAGYQPLEKPQTPAPPGASQGVRWASSAVHHAASTDDTAPDAAPDAAPERRLRVMRERTLKHELQRAVDLTEDLELQALLAGRQVGVAERHQEQQARVGALRQALTHQAPELAISPELRKASVKWREDERSCGARCMQSSFVSAAKRSLNGLVVIWLYFADVISDIEVAALLYESGMLVYACIAGGLLVLQFLVVYLRVLPYLHATFGRASCPYQLFLWLGFPFGMLGLDLFMFLEPFGLLRTLPLPDSLRQFVPAYKATRIIAEVMIESLPQCLLQSYILVTVMRHVRLQHESASEHELMMASMNGIAFAELLPRSITISVVTMLKTWIELVYSAREAGISVRVKAAQLWHVGHGLPLDALKKGALFEWSCTYILSDGEVPPLMDALIKNASLTHLNLARAGLEWDSSEARMERSGAALIEAMATSPAACSELQALIVGPSGFEVPIGRLRKGGASALAALRDMAMLSPGGPWRLEIQLMADLLRKPRGTSAATTAAAVADAKGAVAGVVAKFIDAAARGDIRREQWEETLTQLMVAGEARRAHVKALLTARVLRLVGMRAKTLLAADFCEEELFVGGFEAAELLALGCTHARLYGLGYTPRGLKSAGLSASELRNLGCSALSLKRANYAAEALLLARYPLTELRQAAYSPAELLRAGGCTVAQLRAVGVEASELKVCLKPEPKMELIPQAHLNPQAQLLDRAAVVDALRAKASAADAGAAQLLTIANLREGGYSAIELKGAGFDCKQVFKAGYDATEATKAQYSLAQLVGAGYRPPELRRAGHEARGLREVGISLDELRRAEYSPRSCSRLASRRSSSSRLALRCSSCARRTRPCPRCERRAIRQSSCANMGTLPRSSRAVVTRLRSCVVSAILWPRRPRMPSMRATRPWNCARVACRTRAQSSRRRATARRSYAPAGGLLWSCAPRDLGAPSSSHAASQPKRCTTRARSLSSSCGRSRASPASPRHSERAACRRPKCVELASTRTSCFGVATTRRRCTLWDTRAPSSRRAASSRSSSQAPAAPWASSSSSLASLSTSCAAAGTRSSSCTSARMTRCFALHRTMASRTSSCSPPAFHSARSARSTSLQPRCAPQATVRQSCNASASRCVSCARPASRGRRPASRSMPPTTS